MRISSQRTNDVIEAFRDFHRELAGLHDQGLLNGCIGWPECDCRLAEQIRWTVHIENEWTYRLRERESGKGVRTDGN
jgi:hypothetical protein